MHLSALRALEFDRIVEAVTSVALTPMGAERLQGLAPATEAHAVAHQLAATSETARYLSANGPIPLRASGDLPQVFAALLGMLNSCASGVSVVNIDNGFGAASIASLINHL